MKSQGLEEEEELVALRSLGLCALGDDDGHFDGLVWLPRKPAQMYSASLSKCSCFMEARR
jgi:hypothetical protein